MTKRDKITQLLAELGFEVDNSGFRITKGPKAKSDILECWNVGAWKDGKHYHLHSGFTMTQLVKGLEIKKNYPESYLYGDFIVEPKQKS